MYGDRSFVDYSLLIVEGSITWHCTVPVVGAVDRNTGNAGACGEANSKLAMPVDGFVAASSMSEQNQRGSIVTEGQPGYCRHLSTVAQGREQDFLNGAGKTTTLSNFSLSHLCIPAHALILVALDT